jgi:carboxyl-terminal processing protease
VYGGGGIQPDLYVKMDTMGLNKSYTTLVGKKVLFDYVFDVLAKRYTASYLDQNLQTFSTTEHDYNDLIRYIQKGKIAVNVAQLNQSKSMIAADLKVLLYKFYFGEAGYYKAANINDKMVKQALVSLQ